MKHGFSFSKRLSLASLVFAAAAALSACSDDTTSPGGGTAAAVAVSVAPAATSPVATAIAGPAVLVTGAGGQPVAGVIVKFTVSGGGAIQYPIATTDAQGIASAGFLQVGPKVGPNVITATVEGLPPLTFTVASQAGPAAAIGAFGGDGQTGAPGSTLPTPLAVRISDSGGNAKAGASVTFAVASGGGSLSATTATTDASGLGRSTWTLGTGQCRQSVLATSGLLATSFFASSRGTITVGGTASGTLGSGDCLIGGNFADEYDLTTPAGAIIVSLTTALSAGVQAVTSDGTALVAAALTGDIGSTRFRLITAAGSKAVRATSANAGAYSLSVATTSDQVTDCSPVYLEIGASTTQTLSASDCPDPYFGVAGDPYLVYIPAGVTVRISQSSLPLDAEFAFFSPTGARIADKDDFGISASTPEILNYTATTAGFYKIVASSYCLVADDVYRASCDLGAYTLSVIRP